MSSAAPNPAALSHHLPQEVAHTSYASRGDLQLVTFYLGGELFAVPMTAVREIIRMPQVARLPMAAAHLLGLANLRGSLLPVADLSHLLFGHGTTMTEASRVLIADFGHPVGMVVDHVDKVISVDSADLESGEFLETTVHASMLSGIIKNAGGHDMVIVLDMDNLLGRELARLAQQTALATGRYAEGRRAYREAAEAPREEENKIVVFSLNHEEFAFPIQQVEEIIRLPEEISHLPKAPPHLLGMVNLRHRLVPLVSLRHLFGFAADPLDDMSKVIICAIVTPQGRHIVGILADQVSAVVGIPHSQWEKLPHLYQKRQAHGEIDAICNLDNGARLISVLASDRLLDPESLHMAIHASRGEHAMTATAQLARQEPETEIQFVVFLLAAEEYGVPIHYVQEIIRVPEVLTHLPNTPPAIEGMVNLRGMLLPVIDLRTRMAIAKEPRNDQQRIVVFTHHGSKTGFIVDSVSEVIKLPGGCLEPTPELAGDMGHLLANVANLPARNRMILILDVEALIRKETPAEAVLLAG